MNKSPREPLARNEPIRKKKPATPATDANGQRFVPKPKLLSRTLPKTVIDTSVRVFRPETATPAPIPDDAIGHRKLIRTTMEDVRRRQAEGKLKLNEAATSSPVRGQHAPDQSHEEFQYLSKLAENKTPIVVKMVNGEILEGWIEYIDKNFIRLTRKGKPNLFVYKTEIQYLKETEMPSAARDSAPLKAEKR